MLVEDIMTKNPESLPLDTPIQKVAKEMEKLDCGFMPIAENGKIGLDRHQDPTEGLSPHGKNHHERKLAIRIKKGVGNQKGKVDPRESME